MFKRIIVPLDGSTLAETVLPAVVSLAEKTGAPVTLLHVIEQDASNEIHQEHHLTKPAEAKAYLKEIASRFAIQMETHVHSTAINNVARSIIEHAKFEFQPDLIVMCSHGKGGLRELLFGSIAQQVIASGSTPVLLLRADGEQTFALHHILVPLDDESIHDECLPITEALARVYEAEIILLCVISILSSLSGGQGAAGGMLPTTARAYLDLAEETAHEHLEEHVEAFNKAGLPSTYEILRGDPATIIAKTAEKIKSDLIVFGTHGNAGLDALWNRSITAAVARRTHISLILIPLSE